jgi:branched-chain amino acid transport system substrate-binding protein
MAKYMPGADLKDDGHNFGYSVANNMVEVLKRAGDNLTRENIMKVAASLKGYEAPLLIKGITVNTSPTDFYPIQSVRMSRVQGESFVQFGDVIANESE